MCIINKFLHINFLHTNQYARNPSINLHGARVLTQSPLRDAKGKH